MWLAQAAVFLTCNATVPCTNVERHTGHSVIGVPWVCTQR